MACGRLIRHLTTSKLHSHVHGQELALHLSVTLTVTAQTSAAKYLHVHADCRGRWQRECTLSLQCGRLESDGGYHLSIYLLPVPTSLYLLVALPQVLYMTYIPVSL